MWSLVCIVSNSLGNVALNINSESEPSSVSYSQVNVSVTLNLTTLHKRFWKFLEMQLPRIFLWITLKFFDFLHKNCSNKSPTSVAKTSHIFYRFTTESFSLFYYFGLQYLFNKFYYDFKPHFRKTHICFIIFVNKLLTWKRMYADKRVWFAWDGISQTLKMKTRRTYLGMYYRWAHLINWTSLNEFDTRQGKSFNVTWMSMK